MFFVYLIKSINFSEIVYVGYTINFEQRLETHNSGGSIHIKNDRLWKIITYIAFDTQEKATAFEKYIKIASGAAFAQKRFW